MAKQVPSLKTTVTHWLMQKTLSSTLKMTQNLGTSKLFWISTADQQSKTYTQAKRKLENLEKYTKKLLETMEGKCSTLWAGALTDLWDEIDYSNQITSWNFYEHMSDFHGLEDGCVCFREISEAIVRELIRLLLHLSFSVTMEHDCTSTNNPNEPPSKKRKLE